MSLPIKTALDQGVTDSQWQAIFESGQNILVSASAGSGKTTVLVRRVIEKIIGGVGVDELLIVTFTEAAASEMKQRIETALKKSFALANGEERAYFQTQLDLLPQANISTLHAFCMTVVQRYYYLIGLDPKFRMLTDATEIKLLKEDVWEKIRQESYGEPTFQKLTNNFSGDRNDDGLAEVVDQLTDFSRSHPYPEMWLNQVVHLYENERVLEVLHDEIIPLFVDNLDVLVNDYEQLIATITAPEMAPTVEFLQAEKMKLVALMDVAKDQPFASLVTAVTDFTFETIKKGKKLDDDLKEFSKTITQRRNDLKKSFESACNLILPEDPFVLFAQLPEVQTIVGELSQKAKRFLSEYTALKRERNLVDFDDLQHLALQILQTKDVATGLNLAQLYYRKKFQEVMVDEYQDINQLQDTLIASVAQPDNLFMVGDVKQSIYSFRQAEPSLFLEKYHLYEKNDPAVGTRILLQENFRSRKEVLDFTNLIFTQLMDEQVGQLDYDESATLKLGFKGYPDSEDFKPELLIYEKGAAGSRVQVAENSGDESDDDDPTEIEDKSQGELMMVATKIQQLIADKFEIYDKSKDVQAMRPLRYSDIVLLAPTRTHNLDLQDIFKQFNIPIVINDTKTYFQATEIKTMLAMLEIIDNPIQDIPLVAVLRSAMVGLNETDLAAIRAKTLDGTFYQALRNFSEETPSELTTKITAFLAELDDLRNFRKTHRLADLIWKIYQDTYYFDYVGGLPNGRQRQANLTALANRATQYEAMNYRGLYQFIQLLKKMREKEEDLGEPDVLTAENAVQFMTIHGSKGLEFPVVFLLDMNKWANLRDLNSPAIAEKNSGIGISFLDADRVRHTTYPRVIITQKKKRLLLSEEMRKLYVALTRAEQKLFLVGSYESEEKMWQTWQKAAAFRTCVIPAALRLNTTSFMDWIGFSLIRHPQFQNETLNGETLPELGHFGNIGIQFYKADDFVVAPVDVPQTQEPAERPELSVLTDKAKAILDYQYPFEKAVETASYQSVSEIKQLFVDPDEKGFLPLDTKREKVGGLRFIKSDFATPEFIEKPKVTAATIGTATHKLMQLISLETRPTADDFISLAQTQVDSGLLNADATNQIDFVQLTRFFDTTLGAELLDNHTTVKREQPFSLLMPANELFPQVNFADDILIHGIIDGYYTRAKTGELVIFDFKTDHVAHLDEAARADHFKTQYAGQLNLYAKALQEKNPGRIIKKYIVALDAMEIFPS